MRHKTPSCAFDGNVPLVTRRAVMMDGTKVRGRPAQRFSRMRCRFAAVSDTLGRPWHSTRPRLHPPGLLRTCLPRAMDPYVLPFSEVGADSVALVGGKGANLGEMARAGFPVPPGFCVTTAAYREFVAASPELDGLLDALEGTDPGDLWRIGELGKRIRDHLDVASGPRRRPGLGPLRLAGDRPERTLRGPLERHGRGPPHRVVRGAAGHLPERPGRGAPARRREAVLGIALHRPGHRLSRDERLPAPLGAPLGGRPADGLPRGLRDHVHRGPDHRPPQDRLHRRELRDRRGARLGPRHRRPVPGPLRGDRRRSASPGRRSPSGACPTAGR